MRVLHVYSGNLFGGIETILLSLVRHRMVAGVSHEFALCFDARLAGELRASGAAVEPLAPVRASRPHTIRQARRRLGDAILARKADVVVTHAPWAHALFAGTARRADVPLAFWAHDAWSGRHWTERWARRTTPDLVIANSEFTADTMTGVFRGVPRTVVHAPIDVTPPRLTEQDRRELRRELATPESAIVVVQASRMEAWKGHATLLRALAGLRHDPRWICWLVGGAQRTPEREYIASLRRLGRELGIADRVRFVGERNDVPRLLAAADVCCQPNSAPEPFGIVLVEALAAGLPVVTAATGGAVEIVDDSCGRLVRPDDADGWRAALADLIGDSRLRGRLGAAGPRRAAERCDPVRQLRRLARALGATRLAAAAG